MGNRLGIAPLAVGLLLGLTASAVDVSVAFVTRSGDSMVPVDQRQALWKSPFGGWVVSTWPFGLRIGDQPICDYRTGEQKLLDQATGAGLRLDIGTPDETLDGLLAEAPRAVSADPRAFRLDRRSSALVDLRPGEHVLHPFGIAFAVSADGVLSSHDPRVRVEQGNRRIEVMCHPVTLRTLADRRSVPAPLQLAVGANNALTGLDAMLAEFARTNEAAANVSPRDGFLRLTLYLPPSRTSVPYTVNDTRFEVSAHGTALFPDSADARRGNGGELHLAQEPTPVRPARVLGLRWSGEPDGIEVVCGTQSFSGEAPNGSTKLLTAAGQQQLRIGSQSVRLPSPDTRWPHALLVWDGATESCWLVETPGPVCRPEQEYECRISSLTGGGSAVGSALRFRLESEPGGTSGGKAELAERGSGVYAGPLPSSPGLWQLCTDGGPLNGQALGLVLISDAEADAAVSLFTYRNRAAFRRGDAVDVLWSVAGKRSDAGFPVLLRGNGLETEMGRVSAADSAGCLRLDTTGLAPGVYDVTVRAPRTLCYPLRFRVCQREPVSDFEVYSYVFGQANPCGGSPVGAYYGTKTLATEPGLAPFLAGTNASLDPAFAVYAGAELGPAAEKFVRPSAEDMATMVLASLGMRSVPGVPAMLHHEEWNPKHTLPRELARLQRRLALFVQSRTDVAGFDGVALNWYATLKGYWEESPRLDGHQAQRNAEADKWIAARVEGRVAEAQAEGVQGKQLDTVRSRARARYASSVLPDAYAHYLTDAKAIQPELTAHTGVPSFWLGGGASHPAYAYASLTQRDSVDYTDYGISPWGNFRAPAFLNMGNHAGQKLHCNFATAGRHSRVATAFGAVGRGLDGISLKLDNPYPEGEDAALLRILERLGPYFSALEPLPDVAVYFNGWPQQKSVILHDLARMRRPGMLLSPEDVLAGKLEGCRVLFLAGVGEGEPTDVLDAFRAFEARGGVILKDRLCAASLPGHDIGFAYDNSQVHKGWGLAYPNGEWEFAHLWKNFRETREGHLIAAFAEAPGIPVTTPDAGVVISPLAGRESICCFAINQTLVPLSVDGKWRQHAVLPRIGELRVEAGWHVRDLLRGTEATVEETPRGRRVAVDFTRMEGGVYLLTRREPVAMAIRTEHVPPGTIRLTAWLADAEEEPLIDPMPFEVALYRADGDVLFHKFAALGPEHALDVPVPTFTDQPGLELQVRSLVLGHVATERVTLQPAIAGLARADADLVGDRKYIAEFLTQRSKPVTVLLDEGQASLRPAAERLRALLRRNGREARIVDWDPADVRPLPLRWRPTEEDDGILAGVRGSAAFAWRVDMSPWIAETDKKGRKTILFDDLRCGYPEYGPRLRLDSDVLLFGAPDTHRALADLRPWLRRGPTRNYPARDSFFVQHLWSPFQGGYNGLHLACHDAEGALSAVDCLEELPGSDHGLPETDRTTRRATTPGQPAGAPEDMVAGKFGTRVLDIAFAPGSNRLFVTTDSYGDSLFALSSTGEIEETRALHNRCGNNLWYRSGGRLRAIDHKAVRVSVGGADYHYSLDDGWLSKATIPRTDFTGRFRVPIAASTLLQDASHRRTYLGGMLKMQALDSRGSLLWSFDDATVHTSTDDLLYPRSLFPRAVSGDGRVLLVAGFGIKHDCYSIGKTANPSLLGLDAATGELLWRRDGLLLNEGKAIAMTSRFLVADDDGGLRVVDAATGEDGERLRPVADADWMLPVPGRDELLIVENTGFDRGGPTARVYLRPLGDAPDRALSVRGRVTDVCVSPNGGTITLATNRNAVTQFSVEGDKLWRKHVPSAGLVRLTPDGRAVLVGARDGVLHWLDATDGKRLRTVDLNRFNVTTGERFVRQLKSMNDIPSAEALTAPRAPPEASYLTTLDPDRIAFSPNLLPPERVRPKLQPGEPPEGDPASPGYVGQLEPEATFTLRVESEKTYLVELLAAAADPARLATHTRLEATVCGIRKGAKPVLVSRLPLGRFLARKRLAFRPDTSGDVMLRLRAVHPRKVGIGKKATMTYAGAGDSEAGLLVGDLVVVAIGFRGPNLLLEGGPESDHEPQGALTCEVKPWTGGNSTIRWQPYPCPQAALRCVDGVLSGQETTWTTEAKGPGVAYAEGRVRFKRPQALTAIALYEDTSGPVATETGVRETVSTAFGVYIRDARTREWLRVGHAVGNRQLVSIFECPGVPVDEIRYFRAGRNDTNMTDGIVRLAEIEAYADDISGMLDDVLGNEGLLDLE